jgi:hypothetical protein
MTGKSSSSDRRITTRVNLQRMMFLGVGEATYPGTLRDVSVSGAKFVFDDKDALSQMSSNDKGYIVVDGLGEVHGTIARFEKGSVVFTFDVSRRGQDQIIADIMIALNAIDLKPEA